MSLALKKKTWVLMLIFFTVIQISSGQKTVLSLDQIQDEVQRNYPLVKGKELLRKHSELSVENIKIAYLPKLYANGKMSYQSDVTSSPISGTSSFGAPKDQYSVNLDVEQLIYNGGRTKSQLNLNKLSTELEIQDLEVKMFALRERVNEAFFSILLLRQSRMVIDEKKKSINASLKQVKSAVNSGVMAMANSKVLEAEILLINQQVKELEFAEKTAFETLAELMNRGVDFEIESEGLDMDQKDLLVEDEQLEKRPEYQLYAGQKNMLTERIELVKKDRLPVITGFGQLGYGQPGYNQLNDAFDSYYMIGAKVSWNIFDWKAGKRNQRKFDIQRELVETQESSFQKNQKVSLRKEYNNISKFEILLTQDDAIVELQEDVTKSSSSKLDNGIITSSDYLEDLNKEIQAKLNREYHQIQLSQSIAEYNRIIGKTALN
jgi:outer membrane protein TolC